MTTVSANPFFSENTSATPLPFDLPPYVFAHYRQGLWTAVNYTDKTVAVPVPDGARILVGEAELPPAGVLVWKESSDTGDQ